MANYKRRRPRTASGARGSSRGYWLRHWPRWWDIEFHTRPKRREQAALLTAIRKGEDPDQIAWPLGNHKPHQYYW